MYKIERDKAITLRKQGLSYLEILREVPVAKSTLSTWLKDVGLAKQQKQMLSEKRRLGALRGARARHIQKEKTVAQIKSAAKKEVERLSRRELWLIGTALYWAEGSKEKSHKSGTGLIFNNSDPAMIKLYIRWLREICLISYDHIHLSLYIHETKSRQIESIKRFWLTYINFPKHAIAAVYYKRNKILTPRKNVGSLYYGTLRVKVLRSSALNRKITGWIEGIVSAE